MNIIINENERGFQFQNGVFQRMLEPGKHRFYKSLGQRVEKARAEGTVKLEKLSPKLLMSHKDFADLVTAVDVSDGHLAIHLVDGKIQGALTTGEYFFWSIHQKHEFRLIDVSQPEMEGVSAETFLHIPMKLYTKVEVFEGNAPCSTSTALTNAHSGVAPTTYGTEASRPSAEGWTCVSSSWRSPAKRY